MKLIKGEKRDFVSIESMNIQKKLKYLFKTTMKLQKESEL